jgi:PAS domain S-box-containing protein/putative nucleotidyltransferase with HDIG domain
MKTRSLNSKTLLGKGETLRKKQEANASKPKTIKSGSGRRGAEAGWQSTFDNALEGIYQSSIEGRYLNVNPAMARIYGYDSPEELIEEITDIRGQIYVKAQDRDRFTQLMTETGKVENFEAQNYRKDGSIIWIRTNARLVKSGRTKLYYEGFIIDITEHKRTAEALKASEERFRLLVEYSSDIITILNPDLSTRYESPANERILGYTPEEMIGTYPLELVHPNDLSRLLEVQKEGKDKPGYIALLEYRVKDKNGAWHEFEALVRNLIDDPAIKGIILNARDITEHKHAEEKLTASEAKLRALFAAMQDIVLVIDRDGIYRDIAPTNPDLLYRRAEELLGKSLYDVFPREQAEQFMAITRRVLEANQTEQVEYELPIQGRNLWFSAFITPMDENNTVWVARDITDRKKTENALLESEERYRQLVELSPDAVAVIDGEKVLFMNPTAAKIEGIEIPDKVIGMPILDLIHPDSRPRLAELSAQMIKEWKKLPPIEEKLLRVDGSAVDVEIAAMPLLWNEKPVIQVTFRDITERKRAEAKIRQQVERLTALNAINQAISSSFDLRMSLSILLFHAVQQLEVDAMDVLLLDPRLNVLEYFTGRGFRTPGFEKAKVDLGEEDAGRVALNKQMVVISNLSEVDPAFSRAKSSEAESFVAYFGMPLIAKGKIKGVLEVFHRAPLEPDQEWLDFLNTLAGQAGLSIDNYQLLNEIQRSNVELRLAYDTTIEGWSHALDLRDKETEGHTQRVAEMTLKLADAAGMTEEELVHVRRGALLHDIGKMGIPDSILLKPDKLTEEEWEIMRRHPTFAYEMLSRIDYLRPALDIPYNHHEKWDGTGYPRGLKGEQIPRAARLFAIVDVWDALRSDRSYRKSWPREKVLEHIRSLSGTYFDPYAVELFLGEFDEYS